MYLLAFVPAPHAIYPSLPFTLGEITTTCDFEYYYYYGASIDIQ